MESKTLIHPAHPQNQRPIQLVLVRANGPLFYSVAAASLLESLVPVSVQRLRHFFRCDRALIEWLDNEWLPRKAARAKALREYVERTWPEFDWSSAYEQCRAALEADGGVAPHKPTAAHEALARCVCAAQSGVFYRSLARWADDPKLRALAGDSAAAEAESFGEFRAVLERRTRVQRLGIFGAWCTAAACMRSGRDLQLALVFRAINAQCSANVPFPVLDYADFLSRMRSVIVRHGHLGRAERILFRPWKAQPSEPRTPHAATKSNGCFRPVLRAAA